MHPRYAFVLVSSLLACSQLGCGGPEAPVAPKAKEAVVLEVEQAAATTQRMPVRTALVGTLVAERQAQIAADTNGVVVETRFERGQAVRKGDVLATVDARTTQLGAAASAAQEEAQRAQATAAESDCARAEDLFSKGVLSQAQVERSRAACAAQSRALEAASASADIAATSLARTQIRAPFDGVIGERLIELGQFVASASPVGTIFASGPLRVKVGVPESQSAGVAVGSAVTVRPSALPERSFPATVKFVSGALREQTRDLVIEAALDAEDDALRPGMFARVELDVGEAEFVTVPAEAIRNDDGAPRVFTVRDGAAYEHVVRLGAEKDGRVAVLTDVKDGDLVILNPPPSLRDGARVR